MKKRKCFKEFNLSDRGFCWRCTVGLLVCQYRGKYKSHTLTHTETHTLSSGLVCLYMITDCQYSLHRLLPGLTAHPTGYLHVCPVCVSVCVKHNTESDTHEPPPPPQREETEEGLDVCRARKRTWRERLFWIIIYLLCIHYYMQKIIISI